MVEMDSKLKGIILNCTLKSYKITPIESANVLRVTMKFYGGFMYKSPSKRRRDKLRKEKFLAKFRRDPILVPIPFLEPGQSPPPAVLGGLVLENMATAFATQMKEVLAEMRGCIRSISAWSRRQRMLKRKGKGCLIGYVILWTRGMR